MDFNNLDTLNLRVSLDQIQGMRQEEQQFIRHQCQTSLRFLANCVLRPSNAQKFPSLVEKVHGKIIDAFPKCDPNKPVNEWSVYDEYVVLASRGMLKSTIGAAFLTQAILCAPDIRVLIISGKIDKSQSILDIARKPFLTNQVIRHLFPEWQIDDQHLNAEEFTTPRRDPEIDFRDPTLAVASFDSVKAGWHGELVLLDDATNEQNSNNIENCEKTHGSYDETDELIEPNCLRVFLGTKWHDEDLPAYIEKKSEQEFTLSGRRTCHLFILPAWTLRTDGTPAEIDKRHTREKQGTLRPEDVDLTWPEKLDANFLFKIYRKNRADFYKQYLLDSSFEQQKSFTEEVLEKQIVSAAELLKIPVHDRAVVIHWDFGSVWSGRRDKSEADYSCGIVAVFRKSTGQMFVADATLQHFVSGDDMASGIVNLYKAAMALGPIVGHSAEDADGIRNIESSVLRLAELEGLSGVMMNINFIRPFGDARKSGGNQKNVNIALLASAMRGSMNNVTKEYGAGSVFILNCIPHFDEIKVQFEKWTIDAKRRKDDAPDCIAQAWTYYKGLIAPDAISNMEPDGMVLSWPTDAEKQQETDSHADEDADFEYLESDTVHFFS